MVSFAFWYKESDKANRDVETGEKELSALMNFNLWCQCGWKPDDPYLDIGFKVENLSLAEELFFYLPFPIPEPYSDFIEDLGGKFKETELVDAVFNKNYSVEVSRVQEAFDRLSKYVFND